MSSAPFDISAARAEARKRRLKPWLYQLLEARRNPETPNLRPAVDWDAVGDRLRSHPDEAVARPQPPSVDADGGGTTTGGTTYVDGNARPVPGIDLPFLHEFLRAAFSLWTRPPLDVLRAAIEADPGALTVRAGPDLDTPLHLACTLIRAPHMVRIILDACPDAASMENRKRQYPLHLAVHGVQDARFTKLWEVVEILLEAYPEAAFKHDLHDESPLCLACRGYKDDEGWDDVLVLLLRARYCRRLPSPSSPSNRPFRALRAYFESYFWFYPTEVMYHLCQRFPRGASDEDEDGSIPLHVCLSTYLRYLQNKNIADHHEAREAMKQSIETLLELNPSGAGRPRYDGRLPLHLAIDCGLRWEELLSLVQLAPLAIETRDVTTRMYPFMAAAVGPNSCIGTIYHLLLESPTMAWQLASV